MLNNKRPYQFDYSIKWDSLTNKIGPGVYQHELKGDRIITR